MVVRSAPEELPIRIRIASARDGCRRSGNRVFLEEPGDHCRIKVGSHAYGRFLFEIRMSPIERSRYIAALGEEVARREPFCPRFGQHKLVRRYLSPG